MSPLARQRLWCSTCIIQIENDIVDSLVLFNYNYYCILCCQSEVVIRYFIVFGLSELFELI